MSNRNASYERRPSRPSIPPPAPQPSSGLGIPRELTSSLGVVLWRAVRDVQQCTETAPQERQRLLRAPTDGVQERFALARDEAPELVGPLATFAFLLHAPAAVEVAELAVACHQVYEWADAR